MQLIHMLNAECIGRGLCIRKYFDRRSSYRTSHGFTLGNSHEVLMSTT